MTEGAEPTPTQLLQALVPELKPEQSAPASDVAERLLLLLHYAIDWDNSWVGEERYRVKYWDDILPGRVQRAAYRANNLNHWWSEVSTRLDANAPQQPERQLELAVLLGDPDMQIPVLTQLRDELPALVLRVRIIAGAAAKQRAAQRQKRTRT